MPSTWQAEPRRCWKGSARNTRKSWPCAWWRTCPSTRWPPSWARAQEPSNSSSAGPSRTSRHKRLRETRRIMSDTAGSRNHGAVDQLLLEAGMDDDGQLRHALVNLRALAAQAPEPSADIAALMAGASAAGPAVTTVLPAAETTATSVLPPGQPADELAARRKAKRRITLTTLSVAASLAAGGAVAAASDQGFRESFAQLNHAVTSFVAGSAGAPTGHDTGQVPAPLPTAARPSAPTSPDSVPVAPA